jgi:hypothetical protein
MREGGRGAKPLMASCPSVHSDFQRGRWSRNARAADPSYSARGGFARRSFSAVAGLRLENCS